MDGGSGGGLCGERRRGGCDEEERGGKLHVASIVNQASWVMRSGRVSPATWAILMLVDLRMWRAWKSLCRRAQQEVGAGDRERQVGRPGGEQGRQSADLSHGAKEAGDSQVGYGDGDSGCDADESSAFTHGYGEWHSEDGHHKGDRRNGKFVRELDAKLDGVEAGLAEVGDVFVELAVRHLIGEFVLLLEVAWLFADLREGGDSEGLVAGDVIAGERPLPAVVEDPAVDAWVPTRTGGEDAALEGKGLGIELEDGEVGKDVAVGVEGLVVEDACGSACLIGLGRLSRDPLPTREEEGLGRLALDLGAKLFLAAVGVGQVRLVEGEQGGREDGGDDEDGRDDTVEADAGGLHGGELGGAIK